MAAPHTPSGRATGISLAERTAEFLTKLTPPVYLVNPTPQILHGTIGCLYQVSEATNSDSPLHDPSFTHRLPPYQSDAPVRGKTAPVFRLLLDDGQDIDDQHFALKARLTDLDQQWIQIASTSTNYSQTYLTSTTDTAVPFALNQEGTVLPVEADELIEQAAQTAEETWTPEATTPVDTTSWAALLTTIVDVGDLPLSERFEQITTASLRLQTPIDPVTLLVIAGAIEHTQLHTLQDAAVDSGLSSAATVQRRKTTLEDADLLTVQFEPAGRGQPRHRLYPGDGLPRDAPPEQVVETVSRIVGAD